MSNTNHYDSVFKESKSCKTSYTIDISNISQAMLDKYDGYIELPDKGIYYNGKQLTAVDLPGVDDDGKSIVTLSDLKKSNGKVRLDNGSYIPEKGILRTSLKLTDSTNSTEVVDEVIKNCVKATLIDINPYKKLLPYPDIGMYLNYDNSYAFLYDLFNDEGRKELDNLEITPLDDLESVIDVVEKMGYERKEYMWIVDVKDGMLLFGYTLDVRSYLWGLSNENEVVDESI